MEKPMVINVKSLIGTLVIVNTDSTKTEGELKEIVTQALQKAMASVTNQTEENPVLD